MRFTSLIIELIRARPRLVVWIVVLSQAALWLMVSLIFYQSPPGELATRLAIGREYQVGTELGPPLSFWIADIAFRASGDHMFGVYLISELCQVVSLWTLYLLGRSVVGGQHAVLAVLLTMTIYAFGSPGLEFGPSVLARPLWALLLLHSWQLIGQGRRNAWFAWSIEAGLLLLTTPAAIVLLLLLAGFAFASGRGRRTLMSFDAIFALLVVVVLALPYLIWLMRAGAVSPPSLPAVAAGGQHSAWLASELLLAILGMVVLVGISSPLFDRKSEEAPIIFRAPVERLARDFVYFFAIAPALAGSLISGFFNLDEVAGGAGVVLLLSGLALVVASGELIPLRHHRILRAVWAAAIVAPSLALVGAIVLLPWTVKSEVPSSIPAKAVAHFYTDNFERRTNQPLPAVAGDPQLASLVSLGQGRPHLFLDATPQRTPWLSGSKFRETGGIVVWRASDTSGTPPADIAKSFPDLIPEVPRAFERLVNGRQPLLRIGWGIIRPKAR